MIKGKGQRLIPEEQLKKLEGMSLGANPTTQGGEETLSSIEINGTNYVVGGGSLYEHHITITTYGQTASIEFDIITKSSEPFTSSTLRNVGEVSCNNIPTLQTITDGYTLTYFTHVIIGSSDNFTFSIYTLTFKNDSTITEGKSPSQQYSLKTVNDVVTEIN